MTDNIIANTVSEIVSGIVKDEIGGSEARVTKKILSYVDKRFNVVDNEFAKVRSDIKQLSKEVSDAIGHDFETI